MVEDAPQLAFINESHTQTLTCKKEMKFLTVFVLALVCMFGLAKAQCPSSTDTLAAALSGDWCNQSGSMETVSASGSTITVGSNTVAITNFMSCNTNSKNQLACSGTGTHNGSSVAITLTYTDSTCGTKYAYGIANLTGGSSTVIAAGIPTCPSKSAAFAPTTAAVTFVGAIGTVALAALL
jgi:ABC-type phosphate transport system substrate-binding protein